MKLGLQLGYWGAQPPENAGELVAAAEDAGFDAVFTAEAWGSDAYTPLAWWGSSTHRVRLGTSVVQLSARTPTACAMAALTLDHLSGGRHILGLGVSGPQVVEGWYGQPFPKPLARTREYLDIIRQVWAREKPVTSDGPHYPLPLTGERTTGLGKALKPITHPLRADIPIMLGAEGPKNVALAAEICDGWLPIFYTPRMADMYNEWLDGGFARPGARRSREDFEICATAQVVVTEDREAGWRTVAPFVRNLPISQEALAERCLVGPIGECVEKIGKFIEAGCSKFVLRPSCPPDQVLGQIETFAYRVMPNFVA